MRPAALKIVFVCLGNICRSPSAEALCRARLPDLEVDSAGTGGWHVGDPPYGPMQAAARARGIDMSGLRARQLQPDDFMRFDLIFGMDAQNLADIEAVRPAGNTTELRNFAQCADADAIPDPYYTRDFDGALDLLETCVDALARELGRAAR